MKAGMLEEHLEIKHNNNTMLDLEYFKLLIEIWEERKISVSVMA